MIEEIERLEREREGKKSRSEKERRMKDEEDYLKSYLRRMF